MGLGMSLFLIAIGAILTFAVNVAAAGIDLNTIGVILIVVGAIGVLLSGIYWNSWGGFRRGSAVDNEAGTRRIIEEEF